jgi:hypothetical protein
MNGTNEPIDAQFIFASPTDRSDRNAHSSLVRRPNLRSMRVGWQTSPTAFSVGRHINRTQTHRGGACAKQRESFWGIRSCRHAWYVGFDFGVEHSDLKNQQVSVSGSLEPRLRRSPAVYREFARYSRASSRSSITESQRRYSFPPELLLKRWLAQKKLRRRPDKTAIFANELSRPKSLPHSPRRQRVTGWDALQTVRYLKSPVSGEFSLPRVPA